MGKELPVAGEKEQIMTDNRKLTIAELEAILDAARYHADLLNRLEESYHRCDMTQMLILIPQILGIKKESIQ